MLTNHSKAMEDTDQSGVCQVAPPVCECGKVTMVTYPGMWKAKEKKDTHRSHGDGTPIEVNPHPHTYHYNSLSLLPTFKVTMATGIYHHVTMCLIIVLLSSHNALALSWQTRPVNSQVTMGQNVSFKCEFNSLGGSIVEWRQYFASGLDRTLFLNGNRQQAPGNYHIVDNGYGFTLDVISVQRDDDTSVQCGTGSLSERVTLTVLVAPSVPSLTLNTTSLQEDTAVAFTCTSADGNPTPDVTWLRNSVPVSGGTVTPPTGKFGVTIATLVQTLSREDDGAIYRCEVRNAASATWRGTDVGPLSVRYAPVIDFGPYNPLTRVEGESVTLTCTPTANPLVTPGNINWYRAGSHLGTGSSLTLPPLTPADAGVYECRARNDVAERSGQLTLNVHYPARLTLLYSGGHRDGDDLTVDEDTYLNLTCQVAAFPAPSAIFWRRDGSVIHTGTSYVLNRVSRSDAGQYKCEVTNTLSPSGQPSQSTTVTKSMNLTVFYLPGSAQMTVPSGVLKGQQASLSCAVADPGVPPAYFLWNKLGTSPDPPLHNGTTLILNPSALEDNGDYVCTPQNHLGQGTNDMRKLNINERPEWLGSQLPPSVTVIINATLTAFRCSARGRPEAGVTWYKDGVALHTGALYTVRTDITVLDTHSWNTTSQLEWEGYNRQPTVTSLRWEDSGNYSCVMTSAVDSTGLTSRMGLTVQYIPQMHTAAEKVAIDRNQSATLSCSSHATPAPSIEWYNGTQRLSPGGRVSITRGLVGGEQYPHTSILQITDVDHSDLGVYTCRGINALGGQGVSIHLTVKDKPDAPQSVEVMSVTWESVELRWVAGFDGGYPQSFRATYIYYDLRLGDMTEVTIPTGETTIHNVTGLLPSTNYTLTVSGVNLLGAGPPSSPTTIVTDGFEIEAPSGVVYHAQNRTLVFQSPSSNYCARVEVQDGADTWRVYEECAPTVGGSVRVSEGTDVRGVRVALCLTHRSDVCSVATSATMVEEDLSVSTIIIVACVCGAVVFILTIVLIVLCCRRHKAKKGYEKSGGETNQMQTVITTNNGNHSNGNHSTAENPPLKPAIKANGVDNHALDKNDLNDLDDPRKMYKPASSPYYEYDHKPNGGIPNGRPPHHHDNRDNGMTAPPRPEHVRPHDNYMHMGHAHRKDPQFLYISMDSYPDIKDHHGNDPRDHHGNDSALSTPDPTKPKKTDQLITVDNLGKRQGLHGNEPFISALLEQDMHSNTHSNIINPSNTSFRYCNDNGSHSRTENAYQRGSNLRENIDHHGNSANLIRNSNSSISNHSNYGNQLYHIDQHDSTKRPSNFSQACDRSEPRGSYSHDLESLNKTCSTGRLVTMETDPLTQSPHAPARPPGPVCGVQAVCSRHPPQSMALHPPPSTHQPSPSTLAISPNGSTSPRYPSPQTLPQSSDVSISSHHPYVQYPTHLYPIPPPTIPQHKHHPHFPHTPFSSSHSFIHTHPPVTPPSPPSSHLSLAPLSLPPPAIFRPGFLTRMSDMYRRLASTFSLSSSSSSGSDLLAASSSESSVYSASAFDELCNLDEEVTSQRAESLDKPARATVRFAPNVKNGSTVQLDTRPGSRTDSQKRPLKPALKSPKINKSKISI